MVQVIFTNNGGTNAKIVDETKPVRAILAENGFSYAGATLNIDGRAVTEAYLDEPLVGFVTGESVRITAVAHKANA